MKPARSVLLTGAAATLLAACTVGPGYSPPETTAPEAFGALESRSFTVTPPIGAWWTTFEDPVLDDLIARAVRANPDLRRAQARVREARAQVGVVAADFAPDIDAVAGVSRGRTSGSLGRGIPSTNAGLFRAGFDAVWELDVFGGVRRDVEAADADVDATVEDRRDVLVTLLAEVARNYMELRGAQRQAVIAQANLTAQRETLQLTRTRLTGGLATDLDVARSEAQSEATAGAIPAFEVTARQAMHAIAVLVGEEPHALVDALSRAEAIPGTPPSVPVGLPSELLRRRPDIRRAERQLAAATARIGVATAEYFPRFSLTGALGLQSSQLQNVPDNRSRAGSFGAGVRWPIFDFGRIRGNVEAADAREEQAFAVYETTVLTGLREVEDALFALSTERTRRVSLGLSAGASRRAADLANQLWVAGRSDFLSVLQAQRELLFAEDAVVQSDRRAASSLVALYKALGGGWDVEEESAEDPAPGEAGARVLDVTRPHAPGE